MNRWATLLALALVVTGCSKARQYELRGQIIAVSQERGELTIKHDDIKGFMPAMTMPFKVRDRTLLEGRVAGELVTATLVVGESDAYLTRVTGTGHAPLTDPPPAAPVTPGLTPGDPVPDVEFTDQAGARQRLSNWRGRVTAVTFIYTRCPLPNFCPLMDRHFAALQREILADAALRDRARLVSVSFDPQYDTPAVLSAHARRAGADPAIWTFATGDRDAIDRFAREFGVSIVREEAAPAEIVHNLRTVVIDPGGHVVQVFTGNEWTPAEALAAVKRAGG